MLIWDIPSLQSLFEEKGLWNNTWIDSYRDKSQQYKIWLGQKIRLTDIYQTDRGIQKKSRRQKRWVIKSREKIKHFMLSVIKIHICVYFLRIIKYLLLCMPERGLLLKWFLGIKQFWLLSASACVGGYMTIQ